MKGSDSWRRLLRERESAIPQAKKPGLPSLV